VTIKIINTADRIEVRTTTILIYGAPGLRKSSLAYTAEAPLLLDFDKGAHRAFGRKTTVRVESWADVADMTDSDLADYKTIVVDTVGRCLDMMGADIIRKNPKMQVAAGALSLQGYGVLKGAFATWMGWLSSLGKDVVLIAHDREDKKAEELIFRADIQGSSHGEVFKRADGVAYMHAVNRATILDFSPTDRWLGKNPGNFPPFTVPDFGASRDFLAGVISLVKESLNKMSEEQQQLVEQIDEWNIRATEATNAEEINALVADAAELKPPLAPQVKHIIAARAKELDLKYEGKKGQGRFVDPAPTEAAQ